MAACYGVRIEKGDDGRVGGEAEEACFAVGVMRGGGCGGCGQFDGDGGAVGSGAPVDGGEEAGGVVGCAVGAYAFEWEGGGGEGGGACCCSGWI